MKIKQLRLENYGRFDDLTIEFADDNPATIIVGNNGAGKSQILQALALGLSWFVEGIKDSERSKYTEGQFIEKIAIKNRCERATLNLFAQAAGYLRKKDEWQSELLDIGVTLNTALYSSNNKNGKVPSISYSGLDEFTTSIFYQLTHIEKTSLPLIAFYPTERLANINTNHEKAEIKHIYSQLEGYNQALEAGRDFNIFIDWFRNREDIENANVRKFLVDHSHDELFSKKLEKLSFQRDKQLVSARAAIIKFLPDFEDIWIDREVHPFVMKLSKQGETLNLNQLSQGEKSLLALIGDIARRLAILNPNLDNPLEGEGVVLIDEIDLHLHPKWQHDLIDKLVDTFPNCQFILTTHSPHLISDRDDMLVYALNDGELSQVPNVYGEDVNTLLTQVFDVDVRDSKVEKQFIHIRRAISDKHFNDAENAIAALAEQLPTQNVELLKCRLMLAQAQLEEKSEA